MQGNLSHHYIKRIDGRMEDQVYLMNVLIDVQYAGSVDVVGGKRAT